jgi:hypothetical protein
MPDNRTTPCVCEQCNKPYLADIRNTVGRFCSRSCYYEHRRQAAQPISERFWSRVAFGEGCWEFATHLVHKQPRTFYRIGDDGQEVKVKAHRMAWELVNGPIPEGLEVCHNCDNPPCVRPDHLFLGTHQENMDDRNNKQRQVFGERVTGAVLTADDVREIRRLVAEGQSQHSVAKSFGVTQGCVWLIVRGRTWHHLQ